MSSSRVEGKAGRRHRPAKRQLATLEQMPWQLPAYVDAPTEPLNEEGVEKIHLTAMRILEEIGIEFLHEEARTILAQAGCEVNAECVRMDRDFVMQQVTLAPETFSITPRNPQRKIVLGGKNMLFGAVASPPNTTNLDRGRRVGTRQDYQDLIRLTQVFNCLHFHTGYPVEPVDIHASVRHLDALYDMLTLSDKVCHAYSLGPERVEDVMAMVQIAGGLTDEEFASEPRLFTNINSSSPLKHDWPMLDGAMRMARKGQPVVVTPFTLAGAMAPITLAGAVAQQTAEALAAIALLQVIRPGTPVVYGAFTSNVDMRSGAPAFGTPEYMRAMQISGQLARRYKLPMRASNANACNTPDAQATWESVFSLWGSTSGHTNMMFHSAGWMEGGLSASFEKFIIDCELLQQLIYYHQPVGVTDEDLAFDAIKEVGPNSHFLGCSHTKERYQTAFYQPFLSDWSNYESWEAAGSIDTVQRANRLYKKILKEFEPPAMDSAIEEELSSFVEKRRKEGGAKTDF
ncbi:MAG: trimethylamine--corrinoid protein Co-methyltransferase [Parasphingorhabdus sp.]|jgi:trimethylamine--corrinoid protein Co-methyltransferase